LSVDPRLIDIDLILSFIEIINHRQKLKGIFGSLNPTYIGYIGIASRKKYK